MKKRWMVLGIIIALVMGYCQMVAQADVGGSFSGSSSSSGGSSSSGRGQLIAHILICLIGDDMGRRIRLLC